MVCVFDVVIPIFNTTSLLVRRGDIEHDIDQCQQELDVAIQAFTVRSLVWLPNL